MHWTNSMNIAIYKYFKLQLPCVNETRVSHTKFKPGIFDEFIYVSEGKYKPKHCKIQMISKFINF